MAVFQYPILITLFICSVVCALVNVLLRKPSFLPPLFSGVFNAAAITYALVVGISMNAVTVFALVLVAVSLLPFCRGGVEK